MNGVVMVSGIVRLMDEGDTEEGEERQIWITCDLQGDEGRLENSLEKSHVLTWRVCRSNCLFCVHVCV